MAGLLQDLTEGKHGEEQMRHLAHYDSLSCLITAAPSSFGKLLEFISIFLYNLTP